MREQTKNRRSGKNVIRCSTADEFLDAISPRGKYLREFYEPSRFLFRGHADGSYQLVPSVFRFTWNPEAGTPTNRDQVLFELSLIRSFYWMADRSGLPLPEDSQAIRQDILDTVVDKFYGDSEGNIVWPPREIWSLLALAQHHGLPTRLLDWSLDSKIAGYFAAVEAARWVAQPKQRPVGVKNLAVWALSTIDTKVDLLLSDLLSSVSAKMGIKEKRTPFYDRVSIVTAPSYGNQNLHAQKGLFTLLRPVSMKPMDPVDRRPLDRVLIDDHVNVQLTKFVLPLKHAPELLRLLAWEGISGAQLFPGYDGIVKGLKEERLWNEESDFPLA